MQALNSRHAFLVESSLSRHGSIAGVLLGTVCASAGCLLMARSFVGRPVDHRPDGTHSHRPHRPAADQTAHSRYAPALGVVLLLAGGALLIPAVAAIQAGFHLPALAGLNLRALLFVTGLGLILGMRHSTDADHVVAISTILSKQRSIWDAALVGSVWGVGHTITIFLVGSLIILFGVEIPPRIGLSMEFCVAVMLVLLGVLNLTGVLQTLTERFTPPALLVHEPAVGADSNRRRLFRRTVGRLGLYQTIRPLVIGLVHGLAGSAAVALLVLSTIHDPVWAAVYLLVFGAGTMLGMMCMTAAMAVPFRYASGRSKAVGRYLNLASGMVSLCFGSFLMYQLGIVGGLFSSHPQWTPH